MEHEWMEDSHSHAGTSPDKLFSPSSNVRRPAAVVALPMAGIVPDSWLCWSDRDLRLVKALRSGIAPVREFRDSISDSSSSSPPIQCGMVPEI